MFLLNCTIYICASILNIGRLSFLEQFIKSSNAAKMEAEAMFPSFVRLGCILENDGI